MSDILRFGTIGTNFISDTFAEAVGLSGVAQIAAVYSRNHETGAAFAAKHGVPAKRVYTSLDEMAESADSGESAIDAVYIASPNKLHLEQSLFFLRRGIPVLCEKPIAADYAEYALMRRTAEENGVVLLEAMRQAHDPTWQVIKDALPRIGKIRHAALEFCQYSSRYKRHLAGERTNTFDPSFCNAALMDLGVYPLHCLVTLFGEPESVAANSVFLENGFEASGEVTLTYGDFTASALYSKVYDSTRGSAIFGEDGTIFFDKTSSPASATLWLRDGNKTEALPIKGERNNMIWEIRDFAELIKTGNVCHKYADDTAAVMKILDAARAAAGIVWR